MGDELAVMVPEIMYIHELQLSGYDGLNYSFKTNNLRGHGKKVILDISRKLNLIIQSQGKSSFCIFNRKCFFINRQIR